MKSSSYNKKSVAYYCHFGWGDGQLGVANYPERCAKAALSYMKGRSKRRAFDIGCATGRSSFELAREFDEVIGIDLSAPLILAAQRLKESGKLHYAIPVEGEHEISLRKFGLEHASKKVNFWQADASVLKPIFSDFDLILVLNITDTMSDPKAFLQLVADRICKGGLLILSSSYGEDERGLEELSTLYGFKKMLEGNFRLIDTKDIPCVFQKGSRAYRYDITQMSIWERQ
jgi:putative 4-mercaptohistidine N1-methyltranferase